jgi:DNA-binding XRE family transcriptional regulator
MINIRERLTLKSCRITAGVKVEEIAKAAGVTTDTVYKWEKGRSFPNAPQIVKILNFYAEKGYVIDVSDINFFA